MGFLAMRNRKLVLLAASVVFVCITLYTARNFLPQVPLYTYLDSHGYASRLTATPVADGANRSGDSLLTRALLTPYF